MADETIYRCINEACGRPTPRRVKFCPWCGTAQTRAGARATRAGAGVADATASPASAAAVAAAAGASAAAALSGWSDAPPAPSASAVPPASAAPTAAAPPNATGFGHSARPGATADAAPPPSPPSPPREDAPRQEVPRPPLAAQPAQRSPIRLRWWVLALVVLWGVWLLAKPSTKKIERQIDASIALARECRASDAQAGLIALRKSRATPEQLQRLQQALNDEAAKCTRRRQREKAWNDASGAVESALAAANWDRAKTRLQAFTRRWGEDDDTRAMQERIEAARRDSAHPLAVPRSAVGSSSGGATGAGRVQ